MITIKLVIFIITYTLSNAMSLIQYQNLQKNDLKTILNDADITQNSNYPTLEKLMFITPWNKKGQQYTLKYGSKLNYISPCWYDLLLLRDSPAFQNVQNHDSQYMTNLRSMHPHIKILPRMYVSPNDYSFFQTIGSNQQKYLAAASLIISQVFQRNYDGIIWDCPFNFMEEGKTALNILIVDFINLVKKSLAPSKLVFFNLANPIDHMNKLQLKAYLSLKVDALLIQNYDRGFRYLDMVDKSIEWSKKINTSFKIILMLPFFSVQQNNRSSLSTIDAISALNQKGVASARISNGICLFGTARSKTKYYIPCYSYFKKVFERAVNAGVHVGFWEGGNGIQNYYKFL